MINFISEAALFILIAFLVSLALSIATPEEKPVIIVRTALKNFNLLFLIVVVISAVICIMNLL